MLNINFAKSIQKNIVIDIQKKEKANVS